MILYHFESKNFGDEINSWMWKRLLGPSLEKRPDLYLSGIGTILSDTMPVGKQWVVFGSGVGYRPKPTDFGGSRWNVLAVRGPLTTEILGVDRKFAITDSAILLAALEECAPIPESEREGIAFMPHITANRIGIYKQACDELGITYIDPNQGSVEILQQLRRTRLVIADAMHAAICADTLRVPWVPVATSNTISSFKWIDWTASMNLEYQPQRLPAPSSAMWLKDSAAFLFGKRFLLKDNSPASAVRDFRARQRLSSNPYYDAYVRGSEALTQVIRQQRAGRAGNAPPAAEASTASTATRASAGPELGKMVDALRAASGRRPFLSDNATYRDRLDAMVDKRDQLKQMLDS